MNPPKLTPPAQDQGHTKLRCDYSVQPTGAIQFGVFGATGSGSFVLNGPLALAGEINGAINSAPALRSALSDLLALFDTQSLGVKLKLVNPDNRYVIDNARQAIAQSGERGE